MIAPNIPSAVSLREAKALQRYSKDRYCIEAGSLLGFSTVVMGRVAKQVLAIDRHTGYDKLPNDTYRLFLRNLDVYNVTKTVIPVLGDFRALSRWRADFAFIDLDGEHNTTLEAIQRARAPIVGVHDYGRQNCKGVESAVRACGYQVMERVDSLVVLWKG